MTRKEFLQTTGGGVAASLYASSPATAAPAANIRLGTSLYSYQEVFYNHVMSFEDIMREAASAGADVIELIPEEMVENFPNPSERWVTNFKNMLDKYHLQPWTYTQFQDTELVKDMYLPTEKGGKEWGFSGGVYPGDNFQSGIEMLERDLKLANRLGFHCMRLLNGTSIAVVEKAASMGLFDKYKVWGGFEVHSPTKIKSKLVERWIGIADKYHTEYIGINPDFGIFAREGGEDARDLIPLKKYIKAMHGKCYDLKDDATEATIGYEKAVPILAEAGFDCAINCEYEGQRRKQNTLVDVYDEVEQVRRWHLMMRRILNQA